MVDNGEGEWTAAERKTIASVFAPRLEEDGCNPATVYHVCIPRFVVVHLRDSMADTQRTIERRVHIDSGSGSDRKCSQW